MKYLVSYLHKFIYISKILDEKNFLYEQVRKHDLFLHKVIQLSDYVILHINQNKKYDHQTCVNILSVLIKICI